MLLSCFICYNILRNLGESTTPVSPLFQERKLDNCPEENLGILSGLNTVTLKKGTEKYPNHIFSWK